MICSTSNLITAVLFSALTRALCDTDLALILTGAAHKLAWDHYTEVDTSTLAGGFCFSSTDLSQGQNSCSSQTAGLSPSIILVQFNPLHVYQLGIRVMLFSELEGHLINVFQQGS